MREGRLSEDIPVRPILIDYEMSSEHLQDADAISREEDL